MASLYKNGNYWYIAITYKGRRLVKSLNTKDKTVAKRLKLNTIYDLIKAHRSYKKEYKNLSFTQLSIEFLSADHNWSQSTYETYKYILADHVKGKPLPSNPTSRAIYVRHINACWNWGLKNKLVRHAHKLTGDTKGLARHRVFTKNELDMLFNTISDINFNQFVRFAYYTGARSGEIRSLLTENVKDGYLVVNGKSGLRMVKMNTQAKEIINSIKPLWSYTKSYVSHKFKKEVRRLGIKDARFHDLRRTFGYNLIKQGKPIYEVSKLLGHSSVTTTERHYAPLLTTEIEDFVL